ncbi:MAG: CBS and ACT domain-containing protein [Anaerolineales bacterium]
MFVKDRMNPDPVWGKPDMAVTDAQELMKQKDIRYLPICDESNKLVGLITQSSLLSALPSDISHFSRFEITYTLSRIKVKSIMVKNVFTIGPDIPIEDAAFLMAEKRIGTLPVVDDGFLVGIISGKDLFNAMTLLLGVSKPGIRVTIQQPDQSGLIAHLTTAIAKHGGYLSVCVGYKPPDQEDQWVSVCKVENMDQDSLVEVICALEDAEILDIRQFQEQK